MTAIADVLLERQLEDFLAGNALTLGTASLKEINLLAEMQREKSHGEYRQKEWHAGSQALFNAGLPEDIVRGREKIQFPHLRLSLSHSGDLAVAIASSNQDALGVGVDYEVVRPVKPEMARFYLQKEEIEWLQENKQTQLMLMLWSIKEAVFKADMNNDNALLSDYYLPQANIICTANKNFTGKAFKSNSQFQAEYICCPFQQGVLAIAIARKACASLYSTEVTAGGY